MSGGYRMKVVIDIDDKMYKAILDGWWPDKTISVTQLVKKGTLLSESAANVSNTNAIIVPENATNGDMINALFPNAKNIRVDGGYPLNYIIEGKWHRNLKDWWDTPYNSESENKE